MKKIYQKIGSVMAMGSLFLQVTTTAFAASTDLVISGNGADSANTVDVTQDSTTSVQQSNTTSVTNSISVSSDTGNNTVDGATGGDVRILTGDSNVDTSVLNKVNANIADIANSPTSEQAVEVTISGNGADSSNVAALSVDTGVSSGALITQDNTAFIDNRITVDSNTGFNDIKDTTGGDAIIRTGDSNVTTEVANLANLNVATIHGSPTVNAIDAEILGNGADSANTIDLTLNKVNWITQDNFTDIYNRVRVDSNTGYNNIDETTGGLVAIGTGDSNVNTAIDNWAGFNVANLSNGVLGNVLAKIAGNGADSSNVIAAAFDRSQGVIQENSCGLGLPSIAVEIWNDSCFDNHVDVTGDTGTNTVLDTTHFAGNDPLVVTGDSNLTTDVKNAGGLNSFGTVSLPSLHLPGGWNIDLGFNLNLSNLLSWWS